MTLKVTFNNKVHIQLPFIFVYNNQNWAAEFKSSGLLNITKHKAYWDY